MVAGPHRELRNESNLEGIVEFVVTLLHPLLALLDKNPAAREQGAWVVSGSPLMKAAARLKTPTRSLTTSMVRLLDMSRMRVEKIFV